MRPSLGYFVIADNGLRPQWNGEGQDVNCLNTIIKSFTWECLYFTFIHELYIFLDMGFWSSFLLALNITYKKCSFIYFWPPWLLMRNLQIFSSPLIKTSFISGCFKKKKFVISVWQFNYDVSGFEFLWVHPIWGLLNFLNF